MSSSTASKEGYGAPKKVHHEMVTSYKLSVALLIKCYSQFRESDDMANTSIAEKVKIRKSFCILALKLLQGPDLSLMDLKKLFTPFNVLSSLSEKFDRNLKNLRHCGIGGLLDIVDELKQVLNGDPNQTDKSSLEANAVVAKNSVIGYFLRRFIVFFEKLSFGEVTRLFQAFVRYYDDWVKGVQSIMLILQLKVDNWYIEEKQWSRRQAELFLATQAALVQNNEDKALSPQDLQTRISNILKSNPDLAEAHFMSYLNYLRVEEFCGAMQSLFHCFDRRTNLDVKYYSDEKSKEHRYAALNLAILHHHFGYTAEALASLKEAIKTAHEVNDNLCLQHALSWLYRLSNVNKDNLIVQCIIKTFELNISYTTSLALQNFAHYGSAKISVKPSVIFETLIKSDMLNCQHNYKDLIFNNNAMKSSLWRLYGKTEMCSLWAQVLLYLNIDTLSQTSAYYGEGYLQAVCNTALNLFMEGDYNLVHTILQYAKHKYSHEPLAHTWMLVENFVHFTKALYQENFEEAESAAQKILVLDRWEGYLRLAEVFFYQQEYEQASKCLGYVLQHYSYDEHLNDGKFCLLRAKILQAEVQFASSYPNVSGTMLAFNSCLIDAEKSELAYLIAIVQLHMANVLLCLGLTTQAIKVLNNPRCMVEILSNGGTYDKARATLLYLKCLIADSSKLDNDSRGKVILKAAKSLEKVRAGFQKVEAFSRMKDVVYLQAQLYDSLNFRKERNECSMDFRRLDEEYPTKNLQTLVKYL
ncbi:anaphase-promoting complex subunit 5 isoform X2 [Euwallacea similis]|uniref:anaphase-promoting complex subunit 5 isoform X2 n=2 Tax=Euwallacea similis TaxID=1736056 RepID=UPI00344D0671